MWFQGFCEIGGAHCASSSRKIEILPPCLHLGSVTLPLDGNSPVVVEGIRILARAGFPCWNAMALQSASQTSTPRVCRIRLCWARRQAFDVHFLWVR